MTKQDLRNKLLSQRQALAPELRAQADATLCRYVLAWWKQHQVKLLGVYWPIHGEPDLRTAYIELAQLGVQLGLPVIANASAPLQFARWAPGEPLAPGAMKVPVPTLPHRALQPEALLIPCVGFNRQRMRLGYGGGFYDRTLAVEPRPLAIGVAYDTALAEFAATEHDIGLDNVITESGSFRDQTE
jgi:5,10-methenyltetrahydrofolate synthetase